MLCGDQFDHGVRKWEGLEEFPGDWSPAPPGPGWGQGQWGGAENRPERYGGGAVEKAVPPVRLGLRVCALEGEDGPHCRQG